MSYKIEKSFYELLKIGLGRNYFRIFLDPLIILYILIDSYLGFLLVTISNGIFTDLSNNNISILNIMAIIFLPLITNTINILFSNIFLKKKLSVVNNILDYIKDVFTNAPYDFHDKYNVNEKFNCFTTSIWGFDSVVQVLISMCSSFIKIITVSICISISNYDIGILIVISNLILLYLIPKINSLMERMKTYGSIKIFYANAYYNTLCYEENRINPIFTKIQCPDINDSLKKIITRYANNTKIYNIGFGIRNLTKNLLLTIILIFAVYQEKYNYITIILLNKSIIFGFSDFYEELKQIENSNNKTMEELTEMLTWVEEYYKTNESNQNDLNPIIKLNVLTLKDMNYKFYYNDKLVKTLYAKQLKFDFNNPKNIVLISGKTGSGKSLFTKILSGQTDTNNYILLNDDNEINGFSSIKSNRIIINQKVSEEYTYCGNIKLAINKLYPNSENFDEVKQFLKNFGIENKLNTNDINSEFSDKLSGGERQRVALSSMIWKVIKTNPSFIIIDEPEKGIDEETMIKIMDWIFSKFNGLVFLITHNETIKKSYTKQIQSIIKYRFSHDDEIYTELLQEFL